MTSKTIISIVGVLLTFLTAFLIASNISSYRDPSMISEMKESILKQLDLSKENMPDSDQSSEVLEYYEMDIESSLTEIKYKKASLFRIIGGLTLFIGILFLRNRKSIGLHLFLGGSLFILLTGFYVYGTGIIGWAMNLGYLILTIFVGILYYSKLKSMD